MWVLIDNISPNKPVLVNLSQCTDVVWEKGTLSFETADSRLIEVEADKQEFIKIAGALKVGAEIE